MALKSLLEKMMELLAKRASRDRVNLARLFACGGGVDRSMVKKKAMITEGKVGDKGDEEVWRRTIIMGEKCQPLEFSGVIYYDGDGQRVPEAPRSPLRRQIPPSFSFF